MRYILALMLVISMFVMPTALSNSISVTGGGTAFAVNGAAIKGCWNDADQAGIYADATVYEGKAGLAYALFDMAGRNGDLSYAGHVDAKVIKTSAAGSIHARSELYAATKETEVLPNMKIAGGHTALTSLIEGNGVGSASTTARGRAQYDNDALSDIKGITSATWTNTKIGNSAEVGLATGGDPKAYLIATVNSPSFSRMNGMISGTGIYKNNVEAGAWWIYWDTEGRFYFIEHSIT